MWKQLKQLGRQSAIYGLGNVGISLLSFLLVPLYTHNISTGEFGVYSLMLILYSVLSLVADCGFTNSIARYYFDDELGTPALKGITWYRQGLISTAMAISAAISGSATGCSAIVMWRTSSGPRLQARWACQRTKTRPIRSTFPGSRKILLAAE